jgi:exopolysaccharide production protein ExoZ
MKKIQNIQGLRGIAVMLVCLFHLITVEEKYGGVNTILPHFLEIGMVGVDLFFVISGFVMVLVTQNQFQSTKGVLKFLYHRSSRIYPLYWVYSFMVLIIYLNKPAWVNSAQGNQVDIISSFLLLPSHLLPLVMVGCTLIYEMYFYIIYSIILYFSPQKKLTYWLLLWALIITIVNLTNKVSTPWTKVIFSPLTIEFILGCFIAMIYKKHPLKNLSAIILLILISITGLVSGFYWHQSSTGHLYPANWYRVIIMGVPSVIIVYCLVSAELKSKLTHKWINYIGDISYSTYLSHVLTFNVLGRVWAYLAKDNLIDNYIMIPTIIVVTILVGSISYKFIEQPLLKLSRKVKIE